MTMPEQVALFAYGTLRQSNVQLATFGRLLEGSPDALPGYATAPLAISDPAVVATSGLAVHNATRPTGDPADTIDGIIFRITQPSSNPPTATRWRRWCGSRLSWRPVPAPSSTFWPKRSGSFGRRHPPLSWALTLIS
jgi:hypothetical protein